jgi:hypothetical protein
VVGPKINLLTGLHVPPIVSLDRHETGTSQWARMQQSLGPQMFDDLDRHSEAIPTAATKSGRSDTHSY